MAIDKNVLNKVESAGIVPVFFNPDLDKCKKIVKACYLGGSRVFEFTNRGEGAFEVFKELVVYKNAEMPDMILGIGSVINRDDAAKYRGAGADFIVSPCLVDDLVKYCLENDIFTIPGCGTLSEIIHAQNLGCTHFKAFPGEVLGPKFVKAVKGPCPWLKIMPTGGVSTEEDVLKSWFDAGVFAVGMGSKLMIKGADGEYDYQGIENELKNALAYVEKIKK